MAGQVLQFQQGSYATPVNGGALDATVVLSNDNSTRLKHNGHDADATIHLQSSALADRPAAGVSQRPWWTTDEQRLYFDVGGSWSPLKVRAEDILAGTISGNITFGGNVVIGDAAGDTLTVAPSAVTWSNNPTHSGNHTFSGNVTVQGNTTIGNNDLADTVALTARVSSNIAFATDNTYGIGSVSARPSAGMFGSYLGVGVNAQGLGVALEISGVASFTGGRLEMRRFTYNSNDYFTLTDGTGTGGVYLGSSTSMRYKMGGNSSDHRFLVNTSLGADVEGLRVSHSSVADDTCTSLSLNGAMYRVRVGATNSGGTGYRLLRIDN